MSPFETLINLAEKDTDQAAKMLGKAIRTHEDTLRQLDLLMQYRLDYEEKLQKQATQGIQATQYTNYLSFIAKLEHAIEGQKQLVKDAEKKVTMAKLNWQESEKKRLSYNTLNQRSMQEKMRREAKLEQKQTDDFAARSYFYKS